MQRNKEKKENIKRGRKYIRENTTIKKNSLALTHSEQFVSQKALSFSHKSFVHYY
jgi:hypothetical protein